MSAAPRAEVRVLALGDSYTIGESVEEIARWPVQLADAMRAHGLVVAEPLIIAKTGWTTDELSDAIDVNSPSGTFDLVTLLIGVNNQYRGRPADEYRVQFRALLARAVAFAGSRASSVIVVSTPDWGVTPFARRSGRDIGEIARELDAFNAIAHDEAVRAGARFVDITGISRRAAIEPNLIASDGLHPSGSMYELWTQCILPEAIDGLGAVDNTQAVQSARR